MLAAYADLQAGVGAAPVPDGDADEPAHPRLVERLERVAPEQALFLVLWEELSLGVLAAKAVRRLREVVGAKAEERRVRADELAGRKGGPDDLDHGPERDPYHSPFRPLARGDAVEYAPGERKLGRAADLGDHHLRHGPHAAPAEGLGGVEHGAYLRLVYLGVRDADAHAAVSHHRVDLFELARPLEVRPRRPAALARRGPLPHRAQLVL